MSNVMEDFIMRDEYYYRSMLDKQEYMIPVDKVDFLLFALHNTYHLRYDSDYREKCGNPDDEFLRGFGAALEQVLDFIGVEHDKWNPMGYLYYENR